MPQRIKFKLPSPPFQSIRERLGQLSGSPLYLLTLLQLPVMDAVFFWELAGFKIPLYKPIQKHLFSAGRQRQLAAILHGYVFDSSVDWYFPLYMNVWDKLTEVERKNIDLLKRHEAHAAKYYDAYGR